MIQTVWKWINKILKIEDFIKKTKAINMTTQNAQNAQPPPTGSLNQHKVNSSIVLKSLSILLGLFFVFIGAMKISPHLSKDLHKDLVSFWKSIFFSLLIMLLILICGVCCLLIWFKLKGPSTFQWEKIGKKKLLHALKTNDIFTNN